MIIILDDFLSEEDFQNTIQYCHNSSYHYGETDNKDTPPTGMVSNIDSSEFIFNLFDSKIREFVPEVKDLKIYRMYINCFSPGENPYFHKDGESGITCLYYSNIEWNINDGGETQFIIGDEMTGILPIPNRMVCFDANLLHKATSFRNKHRFTIATKYS